LAGYINRWGLGDGDRPWIRYFDSSPEVIRLVVMMYVKYPLSLRNVEDLVAERGIDICHETVRLWWNRFGPMFAAEIRRKRVQRMRSFTHWRWHLDEVYVKINGEMHYLWRAVDHEGQVLESFASKTRDKAAALTFMKKLMKRHGRARAITTDGLRSYKDRHEGAWQRRQTGGWQMGQQPGRELTPAVSTTRAPSTTTSIRTATSSAERPTRPNAQPPWLSGRRSPDSPRATCHSCA
jgi:transposase-like protein